MQDAAGYNPKDIVHQKAVQATAADGVDAIITLAADADNVHVLHRLYFSYDVDPATAGSLTITIDGVTYLDNFVVLAGMGPLELDGMSSGVLNKEVVITLEGVAGSVGKLSLIYF